MTGPHPHTQRPVAGHVRSTRRVELARSLGTLMRDLQTESDRLTHLFAQHNHLHSTDFKALTLIHAAERSGSPLTPSSLASKLFLSSGAATYLVERLVSSGHIVRTDDPSDRRRVILRYAIHGHETAAAYFGPLGMLLATAVKDFDDDALQTTIDVLGAMHTALTSYDAPST